MFVILRFDIEAQNLQEYPDPQGSFGTCEMTWTLPAIAELWDLIAGATGGSRGEVT
jgi:hypothetical protein